MIKKIIAIFIILLLSFPLYSAYSAKEFNEVYDQLVESNEKLKEQEITIKNLTEQLEIMTSTNESLIKQLEISNNTLSTSNEVFSKAKEDLEESNKRIESLMKGGPIIGVNSYFNFNDLPNSIYLGLNVGWKFSNSTALIGSFSTAKSGVLAGLSYNILF